MPDHTRFPALGGTAVVGVTDGDCLPAAEAAVRETVAAFDEACSRFRADSELSALNAAAGHEVNVSALLLDAVAAALRAASLTDGDVDPTVGSALIALGYDRDFEKVRVRADRGADRPREIARVPGWRCVRLDPDAGTIRVSKGVSLDLGATAKALAADRAAHAAFEQAGCGVLVSLGGDMAVAGDPPPGGWRVRVAEDHRAELTAPGQWIVLREGGLATSSTTVRRWGTSNHHLLDPRTGLPAPAVWRTVSVCAGSCLDANIASTAAILRGPRAPRWLESLHLPSRLVDADGGVRHLAGWPAENDDLAEVAA